MLFASLWGLNLKFCNHPTKFMHKSAMLLQYHRTVYSTPLTDIRQYCRKFFFIFWPERLQLCHFSTWDDLSLKRWHVRQRMICIPSKSIDIYLFILSSALCFASNKMETANVLMHIFLLDRQWVKWRMSQWRRTIFCWYNTSCVFAHSGSVKRNRLRPNSPVTCIFYMFKKL